MNNYYSQNEKVDMLLIYGECGRNAHAAERLYIQRYPERQERHPSRQYFRTLEIQFRNQGQEERNQHQVENFIISEEMEINVLAYCEAYSTISTRELARELNISRESVRRILRKHDYKCYRFQLHQHLYDNDQERRLAYCHWFRENAHLNNKILFTDESHFANNGIFNRHNTCYWSRVNRHKIRTNNYQGRFGVNVWAGIIGTKVLGPIFLEGNLTGERYFHLLTNEIENEIDDLPLNIARDMFFHQDGAPPHNTRMVQNYINERFDNRVISTHGAVRWPARSPDLTPMDHFLWGYIKDQVYLTQSATLEELQNKIRNAFLSVTPRVLEQVMNNTVACVNKCIEMEGRHFEHLLP